MCLCLFWEHSPVILHALHIPTRGAWPFLHLYACQRPNAYSMCHCDWVCIHCTTPPFLLPSPTQVRYIGVSNETSYGVTEFCHLAKTAGLPKIHTIQNVYSLLVCSIWTDSAAVWLNLSIISWSPAVVFHGLMQFPNILVRHSSTCIVPLSAQLSSGLGMQPLRVTTAAAEKQ